MRVWIYTGCPQADDHPHAELSILPQSTDHHCVHPYLRCDLPYTAQGLVWCPEIVGRCCRSWVGGFFFSFSFPINCLSLRNTTGCRITDDMVRFPKIRFFWMGFMDSIAGVSPSRSSASCSHWLIILRHASSVILCVRFSFRFWSSWE